MRPDEEGIATAQAARITIARIITSEELRPDEEGIATALFAELFEGGKN